jgi:ATP-dependent exoDNAse (exonuclease V) alpha subunit
MLQNQALDIMKMGYNVYLTGEAGTGKTYVLNRYIHHLKNKNISVAITASTGIAATHIDGVTIDSWSGLGIRDTLKEQEFSELNNKYHLKKRIQNAKVLIIDEISMISGKRFDEIGKILSFVRNSDLPFGGLQVILSGDLFQLPPFSKDRNYFDFVFKSESWNSLDLRICYLHEAKRQKDRGLLGVLSDIRHNKVDEATKKILLKTKEENNDSAFISTKLYTHNVDVDIINRQELEKIKGEEHQYYMSSVGPEKLTEMMKNTCLAPEKLSLKKGALVMFVRNNYKLGYVNGTLGIVKGFNKDDDVIVKTLNNREIIVIPATWEISEESKIIAQITQIPLRLAWAITVHKSQGMTLDAVEIDLSKSFIEGMGYVALSRVKSLKGLKLLGINEMALRVNPEVSEFDKILINLSEKTAENLRKMSWFLKFRKKWKFMYKLTS